MSWLLVLKLSRGLARNMTCKFHRQGCQELVRGNHQTMHTQTHRGVPKRPAHGDAQICLCCCSLAVTDLGLRCRGMVRLMDVIILARLRVR